MIDILTYISRMETPGFFITADVISSSESFPDGLEAFILLKLKAIHEGVNGRKFVFSEKDWRIYLTFFPTDRVVEAKYGLMYKMVKKRFIR